MQSPVFLSIVTFWGAGVRVSTYEFWGQHNSAYNSSVSYLSHWKSAFVRFDLLSVDYFLSADFVHQHFHHSFWIYAICIYTPYAFCLYVFPLIHKIAQENRSITELVEWNQTTSFNLLPSCFLSDPCFPGLHCLAVYGLVHVTILCAALKNNNNLKSSRKGRY